MSQKHESDGANSDSSSSGEPKMKFSEKGKRMAASIAKWLLMRHFFPDTKDKKKQAQVENLFFNDMQFCLSNGRVTKAS